MIAEVHLSDIETVGGSPSCSSAVIQVTAKDNRKFSLLAATPSWFEGALKELALKHYYGPSIVFLRSIEPALARQAVDAMVVSDDRWLTLYDTPHKTLPLVLAEFKARHP